MPLGRVKVVVRPSGLWSVVVAMGTWPKVQAVVFSAPHTVSGLLFWPAFQKKAI
jgi:hypothetical protein